MTQRTAEEKRQAVVFAARFEYSAQQFRIAGTNEHWTGDPFNLPKGVEPIMAQRRRWEYWRAVLPPIWNDQLVDGYQFKHWCGCFSLFCLKQAELARDIFWKDGLGYVEPHHFPRIHVPEPGDVAWFSHNSHYAIVERVRGNLFDSIDGNQGATLAEPSIKLHTRDLSAATVFYSIRDLLTEGIEP